MNKRPREPIYLKSTIRDLYARNESNSLGLTQAKQITNPLPKWEITILLNQNQYKSQNQSHLTSR